MGGKLNRFLVKTPLLYYITDLYVSSDVSCGCVILAKNSMKMPSDSDVGLFYVPDLEHTQHAHDGETEVDDMVHSVVSLLCWPCLQRLRCVCVCVCVCVCLRGGLSVTSRALPAEIGRAH